MVIAVQPRVLGDALSRVLSRERDDVEVVSLSGQPPRQVRCDLALVSGALPDEVAADVVVRIAGQWEAEDPPLRLADVLDRVEQAWSQPVDQHSHQV